MRRIRLGHNAVPPEAYRLIKKVWKSGQYSPGPMVREFEERFAKAHGAKHAIFVNSGTDALRLSLIAMKEKWGWADGAQVAVPALTFVATVNVILQAKLSPFFVDVGMNSYCLNPDNLTRRLTGYEQLVCVMPVHLFGRHCGEGVYKLAKEAKLKVLEDSCETILNKVRGDVSCHSTYMAHHLTTGAGGFALTNDNRLNVLIRSLANHGRNVSYLPGYKSLGMGIDLLSKRFQFDRVGYSCRGTEFEAALGISQMAGLKKHVEKRVAIGKALIEALDVFPDLLMPESDTFMMFPIVIREDARISKYRLCLHLENNGIETRDMMPITSQPCYRGIVNEDHFLVAKWINKNGFYIPCHTGMTRNDVEHIRNVFHDYLPRHSA